MKKLALSDDILMQVDKPARYIGNEVNAVIKDKSKVEIIDIRGRKEEKLQHHIYTDFYNTHKFEWVFFCDIDEYLFGIDNIKDFLSRKEFRHINFIFLIIWFCNC